MPPPTIESSVRDAPHLFGGLDYQALVSLEAWLELSEDESLYLEVKEDFFTRTPTGGVAVQVKRKQKPLTLNSDDVRQAIAETWARESDVVTAFWSTAAPAQDKRLERRYGAGWPELWGRAANTDDGALDAVREVLKRRGGWADDLTEALTKATSQDLRARLFQRLHWELRQPSPRKQEQRVRRIAAGRVANRTEAKAHLASQVVDAGLRRIYRTAQRRIAEDRYLGREDLEQLIEEQLASISTQARLMGGPQQSGSGVFPVGVSHAALHVVGSALAAAEARTLAQAEDHVAAGRYHAATAVLDSWTAELNHSPRTLAAMLRLRARICLALRDAPAAEVHLGQAQMLDGEDDPRLRLRAEAVEDLEGARAKAAEVTPSDPWIAIELALMAGDEAAAITLLCRCPSPETDGPYERQMRVLSLAAEGKLLQALELAAPLTRPNDVALRQTCAFLNYVAAQARGVAVHLSRWPAPTDPGLVRGDADSLTFLREAAAIYDAVARELDDPGQARDLLVWRLACLADLPDMGPTVERLVSELLTGAAPHPGAIHWAVARRISFDAQSVESVILLRTERDQADVEDVVACVVLMLSRGADQDARTLLKRQLASAEGRDHELLEHWWRRLSSGPTHDPVAVAVSKGWRTGDWSALRAVPLGACPPAQRYMALEVLAGASQWDLVFEHRTFLSSLETASGLKLAAIAARNTEALPAALDLIEAWVAKMRGAELPEPLTEIRIEALTEAGRLQDAFALLETWSPKQTAAGARLAEVRLLLSAGDVEQVALMAGQGRFTDLPVVQRVQIASAIAASAPEQARDLLTGVDFSEAPVELAPAAFTAAEHAGLEPKVRRAIQERLMSAEALAAGVIVAVDIDDLMKTVGEQVDDPIFQRHEMGDAPLHRLLGSSMGRAFAPLLTGSAAVNSLLLRNAAALSAQPIQHRTVRLDVSAALVAQALGLLPALFEAFETVQVSPALPRALHAIETDLRARQPERLTAMAEALAAVEQAQLGVEAGASTRVGFVDEGLEASCGDVLDALAARGALTALQVETAKMRLGSEAAGHGRHLADETLSMSVLVGAELALARLLEPAMAVWRVSFHEDGLEAVRSEHEKTVRLDAAADQVRALRRWVATAIRSSQLQLLPRVDALSKDGPVMACLRDLMAPGNAVIWVEDRAVHLVGAENGKPIVEALDILQRLKASGAITGVQQFEAHRQLREGGGRFLNISGGELVALLQRAPIQKGAVVETPELAAVRRAFAGDIQHEGWLRLSLQTDARGVENAFLLELHRKLNQALQLIWSQRDLALAKKRAWSDWALASLRCDRLERSPIAQPEELGRKRSFEIHFLSWMDLGLLTQGGPAHREAANLWAWVRLIAPELQADPTLRETLAELFTTFWSNPFVDESGKSQGETKATRAQRLALCAAAVASMPELMRRWLLEHEPLRSLLRPFLVRPMKVGGVSVPADPVLEAVQRTSRTSRPRLIEASGCRLRVRRATRGVEIAAAKGPKLRIDGEQLRLIAGSPDEQRTAAARLLQETDLTAEQAAAALATVTAADLPYDRLVRMSDAAASTVEGRLGTLREAAAAGNLKIEQLECPDPESLRHWLRWLDGRPDVASLRSLGAEARLDRTAGLPWRAFDDLFPDDEAAKLLGEERSGVSPMEELSLLRLARRCETAEQLGTRLEGVFASFEAKGQAFVELVAALHFQADETPAWRRTDPVLHSFAMWSWGDALWRMLHSSGIDPVQVVAFWQKRAGYRPRAMMTFTNPCASAPAWVTAGRVLSCGLQPALGNEPGTVWNEQFGARISKFMIAEARRIGLAPLGALHLSPDAELSWLADATLFAPPPQDPEDPERIAGSEETNNLGELGPFVAAGPDMLEAQPAARLLRHMQALVREGGGLARRDGVLALRVSVLAITALSRRGALRDGERNTAIELAARLGAFLASDTKPAAQREAVFTALLGAFGQDLAAISVVLARLFDTSSGELRIFIHHLTSGFLAAAPFDERSPIWREQLRQRSMR